MTEPSTEELAKMKKAKFDAQSSGFTCFLIYFIVKAIFLLVLYRYDNYLKHNLIIVVPFATLLVINTYLMLTVGNDPGFQNSSLEENQLLNGERNENNFCKLCNCRIKNRAKHCYKCGKCVRKFDHHCPWINSCVGEKNHFKFCVLLLTHTLQASLALYISGKSLSLFEYKFKDGSFSQQYGVFSVFSIFMLFYIVFAGGLLIFHFYLIAINITSKELLARKKCEYLQNIKGNPFNKGIIHNLTSAMFPLENGNQWLIEKKQVQRLNPTFFEKIWTNDYYSCC